MRLFILSFLLFFTAAAWASETQAPPLPRKSCAYILPYGTPSHKYTNYAHICRHAYVLEYSGIYKIPLWTAHILHPEYTVGCRDRDDSFFVDRSIPRSFRSTPSDYEGTVYDKGHMVSSADMAWDGLTMRETFIMTNIAPQLQGFNRGIWRKLEDQTRAWAQERKHTLLVYSGVIQPDTTYAIGRNGIAVPSGFFKVVVDTVTNEVLAFRFPHTPIRADMTRFLVDIEDIERDAGIRLPLPSGYVIGRELWPSRLKSTKIAKSIVCTARGSE